MMIRVGEIVIDQGEEPRWGEPGGLSRRRGEIEKSISSQALWRRLYNEAERWREILQGLNKRGKGACVIYIVKEALVLQLRWRKLTFQRGHRDDEFIEPSGTVIDLAEILRSRNSSQI